MSNKCCSNDCPWVLTQRINNAVKKTKFQSKRIIHETKWKWKMPITYLFCKKGKKYFELFVGSTGGNAAAYPLWNQTQFVCFLFCCALCQPYCMSMLAVQWHWTKRLCWSWELARSNCFVLKNKRPCFKIFFSVRLCLLTGFFDCAGWVCAGRVGSIGKKKWKKRQQSRPRFAFVSSIIKVWHIVSWSESISFLLLAEFDIDMEKKRY